MSHDIRVFRAYAVHHVTARCYHGELRLTPSPLVNLMAKSTLIRAARRCDARIIVAMTMGNHVELIVMTPKDNLDALMEDFLRELSHRLNRMRGIQDTNFPRRYQSTELGDEQTVASRIVDVLCNPVRARLVTSVDKWPGFSTMAAHRSGELLRSRLPTRRHAEQLGGRGWKPRLTAEMEVVETELARPPIWPELGDAEVQARICDLVDAEEARLRGEMENRNERVVGRGRLEKERWNSRPGRVVWRVRGRYAASDPVDRDDYERFYEATRRQYRRAAQAWRRARKWGAFPPGTFPPGWRRCRRSSSGLGPPIPWVRRRQTGT